MTFIRFMASGSGRVLRIVVGLAISGAGVYLLTTGSIAVGAILRFGISTASTHGVSIHTIGDILILVGVLGVVLWLVVWAPWTRGHGG